MNISNRKLFKMFILAAPVRLELTTHGLTASPLKSTKNATILYFKGIQRFIQYSGYHLVTTFL